MKTEFWFIFLFIFSSYAFSQGKTYDFNSFSVKIENNILQAYDNNNKVILEKKFNDPRDFTTDLDGDSVDEYLVIDITRQNNGNFFTLYIFSTIDSFYVADSIPSGFFEPYQATSEEAGGTIIVSGNPNFDSLNAGDGDDYVPINCWKYDNGEIFSVNDEVYNIFLTENDTLLDLIDSYFGNSGDSCATTKKMKAAIAAAYANYLSAGDKILAAKFLKKYYLCPDQENFKQNITALLKGTL